MPGIDTTIVCSGLDEAVRSVLRDTVELEIGAHEMHEETQPALMGAGVTVIVGVTGDLEGSFTLSLSEDFAIRYTSRLLDLDQTQYDDVVASAIGEFGNMVIAQTSMYLQTKGITCDLCPPTILRSQSAELRGPHSSLFTVRFESEWGEILSRIFVRETRPPAPPT